MHYDGPTYRPPTEQYTPLLQVTVSAPFSKKAEIVEALREGMKEYEEEFLDSVWQRGSI